MTQRSIEILIGRLATDESFRSAFLKDEVAALEEFAEQGHELTGIEIAAFRAVRSEIWVQLADEIDPRLQKATLTSRREAGKGFVNRPFKSSEELP